MQRYGNKIQGKWLIIRWLQEFSDNINQQFKIVKKSDILMFYIV